MTLFGGFPWRPLVAMGDGRGRNKGIKNRSSNSDRNDRNVGSYIKC